MYNRIHNAEDVVFFRSGLDSSDADRRIRNSSNLDSGFACLVSRHPSCGSHGICEVGKYAAVRQRYM